ncbi:MULTISPECIES: transposase [unclassified Variovorax]|uniref:IS66 family insertion sequence element accessory protein TnpA n=1 Tax=unclassified Variovorax TaxID=663243 RepID=UPI0034E97EFB
MGHKRDGRCVYDKQAKQELIAACATSGISMVKLARDCGINANQLSTWVRKHDRAVAASAAPRDDQVSASNVDAFVPVQTQTLQATVAPMSVPIDLQARLPNGVVIDLRGCELERVGQLLDALGRLRCSALTKG